MKKNLLLVFLLSALCGVPMVLLADGTGCVYENGNYAELGEVALDGSVCQADGTWQDLEITYITSDADFRYQKGLTMGDKNNYAKAIEYILLAQKEYDGVELTGSDKNGLVNILLDLSYYYIKNTQYQEALNTSNKILKLGVEYRPSSKSIALNNKGAALDSLGKMNQGKGYYEQALAIDYELAVANDNLDYVNQLSYALDRMYSNAMTVVDTIDDFNAYDDLQRQHAAKYLSILAKKIFKKVPNKKTVCKFTDLTKADKTMRPFIVEACQLGLLGGVKGKFLPTGKITHEVFVNAIGKLIYGVQADYYSKAQENYLLEHLDADNYLNKDESINRGDAGILLYRAYETTLPSHVD